MEHILPPHTQKPRRTLARYSLVAVAATGLGVFLPSKTYAQVTPPAQTGLPANPAAPASAPDAPADKPYVAPANFGEWAGSIKTGVQIEGGITVNPQDPRNHRNFGSLTTDDANRPVLNQALFTISRDVDPKATSVDVGFKLQAMYGSDSRIYQTMGVLDQLVHDRNQIALIEASVSARFPDLFANGTDIKAGIYPTPLGFETIDPKPNSFYSHSYIFNYGLPFKHTGALATAHVSSLVDLYLGIDTGNDSFVAYGAGDNNNRPGGIAGIGLNFDDGKFTILALTHMGPENSKRNTPFANSAMRYYNDLVVNWKTTDKLTLSAEGNYVREDGFHAEGWGIATYASYTLTDTVTLNGRAEIFRDNNNFFVNNPAGNLDYINAQRGTYSNFITASKPTTYSEFTAGITYKPSWLPPALSTAMIRPEFRYDRTLNNSRVYTDGRDRGSVTLATDLILGF